MTDSKARLHFVVIAFEFIIMGNEWKAELREGRTFSPR